MATDLPARLRVASAAAARELADLSRAHAATAATLDAPGRVTDARRLRIAALAVLELDALLMRAHGAHWADVARVLGRDEASVRAQYEPALRAWEDLDVRAQVLPVDLTARFRDDNDPLLTAQIVDDWLDRHRELYDPPRAPGGVADVLTDRA